MCGGDYLLPKRATNQEKPVNQAQEVEVVKPTPSIMSYLAPVLAMLIVGATIIGALVVITR